MREEARFFKRKFLYSAIFILILLLSAGLICYRIAEPLWEGGHHGFVMSEYPHNALNYIRFGYKETKLGLVMNYGDQKPVNGFSYRVDHPMVTPVLISVAYRIFDVSPESARLFPALFALSTSLITWGLSRQILKDRWAAMAALVVCALSPMITYYGRMPAPHNLSASFAFAFFYFYWRWFITRSRRYFVMSLLMFAVGTYTDWVVYFAIPSVVFHYLIFQKDWDLKYVLIFSFLPFLCFFLYISWVWSLSGRYALEGLWSIFLNRTASSHNLGFDLSLVEVGKIFLGRAVDWLTLPVFLLSIAWIFQFLVNTLRRKRINERQGIILSMLVFGFGHNIVFLNRVLVHDFIMYYHLVPVMAIMSASLLVDVIGYFHQKKLGVIWALFIIACLGGFIYQSIHVFVDKHERPIEHLQAYYVGKRLNSLVSDNGHYVDAVDLYQHAGHLRAYVTADRPYAKINTLTEFQMLEDISRYEAVVVDNGSNSDQALREYLFERYHREDILGYSIFDLSRRAPYKSVDPSPIKKFYPISFGDKLEFVGYEIDKIVYDQKPTDNFWHKFLNPHAGYLPQYSRRLHMTNYWRKLSDSASDLEPRTYVIGYDGLETSFGSYASPSDAFYPVANWPLDRIVQEKLTFFFPYEISLRPQALWIGVSQGSNYMNPHAPSTQINGSGYTRIGQVYIADGAISHNLKMLLESDATTPVFANLADKVTLRDVSLSQQGVFPDDVLLIELIWSAQISIERDLKVFVHVIDSSSQLIAQHDSPPKLGRAPTTSWVPGELIRDVHPIKVPRDQPSGIYRIYVGMYRDTDMQRLPVNDCLTSVQDNAIYAGDLVVLSAERIKMQSRK